MELTQIQRSVLLSGEVIQVGHPQGHDGTLPNPTQHVSQQHEDPQGGAGRLLTF